MSLIQLRKAYKISCELTEKITKGSDCLKKTGKYDISGRLGSITTVINRTCDSNMADFAKNLSGLILAQKLRDRVAEANNRPLGYAGDMSINQLIAKQVGLNKLLAFYPEDIAEIDDGELAAKAERVQTEYTAQMANPSRYQTPSTTVTVAGVRTPDRESLLAERLKLRGQVEEVVEKLAYANITERVEITEEDLEILTQFRIPV